MNIVNKALAKQSEVQSNLQSFADELLKDLNGLETLRKEAVIALIDPTETNRAALSQRVAANLKKVTDDIGTYFDKRGRQIKQIDLDGDGSTADDVKALAKILSTKSTTVKDNSAAIAQAETELKKAQDLLASVPANEPLDRLASRTIAKLEQTVKRLDSKIASLGGLTIAQKKEKADMVALGAAAQDLASYDALVKNKVGASTIKLFTDAFKASVNFGNRLEMFKQSAVRFAFNDLTRKGAGADKYSVLADLVLNGVDGVNGQEYTGAEGYDRFRGVVSWYPVLAHKDLSAASIKSVMKIKYDGDDGKISKGAWDGIAPLWVKSCNDAQFKEYSDYVAKNPNLSSAEYVAFAQSVANKA